VSQPREQIRDEQITYHKNNNDPGSHTLGEERMAACSKSMTVVLKK
jgi:hypothetical protein